MHYLGILREVLKTWLKILLRRGMFISFSQFGEDAILHALHRSSKGFYIDVGAYHPTLYSNTFAFYRLGWKGIVIDPNSQMKSLFKVLRPRDRFIECAIGTKQDTATYYEYRDAAYNSLSPEQVALVSKTKGISPRSNRPVPVLSLAELVAKFGVTNIDLLSVDVEGLDLLVLESHDWNIRPYMIVVEDHDFLLTNASASPVCDYLFAKDYALVGLSGLSIIFKDTTLK